MSETTSQVAARTPLCSTPFFHRSHGLLEVVPVVFYQTTDSSIRHKGWGGEGIAVDIDREPSVDTGIAVCGWGNDIYSIFNMRLYYTNKKGQIFERAYTQGREWYDGALTGQFQAAPYSKLAVRASENGGLTWVYYQDPETDEIRALFRSSLDGPFTLTGVRHPKGLKGTSIAAATPGNSGAVYQLPDLKFHQTDLIPPETGFESQLEHSAGAAIAVTKDKVFTVTKNNKIAVTRYDSESHKWQPSVELVDVMPMAPLAGSAHEKPTNATNIVTLETQRKEHDLARVLYTDDDNVIITGI